MADSLSTCKKNKLTVVQKKRLAELLLKRLMKSRWIDDIVSMYQKVIGENEIRQITNYSLMIELNAKMPKESEVMTPELIELIAQCCGIGPDGLTVTKSHKVIMEELNCPVNQTVREIIESLPNPIISTVWRITNAVGSANGTFTVTISTMNERCRFELSVDE